MKKNYEKTKKKCKKTKKYVKNGEKNREKRKKNCKKKEKIVNSRLKKYPFGNIQIRCLIFFHYTVSEKSSTFQENHEKPFFWGV